jgi:hypothetical protein
MNYLHYEFDVDEDGAVEVTLDRQANVRLMDDSNFRAYQNHSKYRYHGGLAKTSPVVLTPPHAGHWHVVIDLGGYPGSVRAAARMLEGTA